MLLVHCQPNIVAVEAKFKIEVRTKGEESYSKVVTKCSGSGEAWFDQMCLAGTLANSINWLQELLLCTIGLSYPSVPDHFLAGDRASSGGRGHSGLERPITCLQSRASLLCAYSQPTGRTSVLLVVGTCSNCKIPRNSSSHQMYVWFTPATQNCCTVSYTWGVILIMHRYELFVTATIYCPFL